MAIFLTRSWHFNLTLSLVMRWFTTTSVILSRYAYLHKTILWMRKLNIYCRLCIGTVKVYASILSLFTWVHCMSSRGYIMYTLYLPIFVEAMYSVKRHLVESNRTILTANNLHYKYNTIVGKIWFWNTQCLCILLFIPLGGCCWILVLVCRSRPRTPALP